MTIVWECLVGLGAVGVIVLIVAVLAHADRPVE